MTPPLSQPALRSGLMGQENKLDLALTPWELRDLPCRVSTFYNVFDSDGGRNTPIYIHTKYVFFLFSMVAVYAFHHDGIDDIPFLITFNDEISKVKVSITSEVYVISTSDDVFITNSYFIFVFSYFFYIHTFLLSLPAHTAWCGSGLMGNNIIAQNFSFVKCFLYFYFRELSYTKKLYQNFFYVSSVLNIRKKFWLAFPQDQTFW
jgi:hypothetical protein